MRTLVWILVICFGGFVYHQYFSSAGQNKSYASSAVATQVVEAELAPRMTHQSLMLYMYGATWCGYCKLMVQEMTAAGIQYKEYMIDTDSGRLNELNNRLIAAGYRPGGSLPVMFAGRHVFFGMTSIPKIESALQ